MPQDDLDDRDNGSGNMLPDLDDDDDGSGNMLPDPLIRNMLPDPLDDTL